MHNKHNLCMCDVNVSVFLTCVERPTRNGKQENTVRHSGGLLCDSALLSIPIGDKLLLLAKALRDSFVDQQTRTRLL